MAERKYKWAAMNGDFAFDGDAVHFKGSTVAYGDAPGPATGLAICDQSFGGGTISATVTFTNPSKGSSGDLVIYYHTAFREFIAAGVGNDVLYGIKLFDTKKWSLLGSGGDPDRLEVWPGVRP